MNITRFEPWNLLNVLHRDLDDVVAGRTGLRTTNGQTNPPVDWIPAVDVVEEKTRYVMRADVPGVTPEDIDISLEKGVLVVAGERSSATGEDTDTIRLSERMSGAFRRRFTLPESADGEDISASYVNGTLEVVIPKQAKIEPRRIAVKAA